MKISKEEEKFSINKIHLEMLEELLTQCIENKNISLER